MVEIKVSSLTIAGRSYNKDKSGYPADPTVFSGLEITWGAPSCIEHSEPSRANISLWVPKTHEEYVPTLGEVVHITGGPIIGGVPTTFNLLKGKVESVKLQDDHKVLDFRTNYVPNPSYEITTSPWTTAGGTLSRTTSFPLMEGRVDDYIAQLTATGSSITGLMAHSNIPVTAGEWVGFSAWTATETSNYQTRIRIGFFNSGGTSLGTVNSTYTANPFYAGGTDQVIGQAPAGTAYCAVYLQFRDGNNPTLDVPAGKRMWADATLMVKGATMVEAQDKLNGGYFDGDTPSGSHDYCAWEGEPHESASRQYSFTGTPPGYRINIVASDALAEAARLRLADSPWPYETVSTRLARIRDLATNSGVVFSASTPDATLITEASDTFVQPRDVDSYPALEAFQRTAMAAGSTIISTNGIVRPASNLNLPLVLLEDSTGASVTYEYTGVDLNSTSVQKVDGVVTRTNYAKNSYGVFTLSQYSVTTGTGGVASVFTFAPTHRAVGGRTVGAHWTTSSTGGTPALTYNEDTSGAINTKVSVGARIGTNANAGKSFKLRLSLYNGETLVNSSLSATGTVTNRNWIYLKVENLNATTAYDRVEVSVEAQSDMLIHQTIYTNGIIIEKATTAPNFFHGLTIGPDENIVTSEVPGLAHFSTGEIVDTTFELDTSKVINEVKVEMKRVVSGTAEDFDQVFTDEAGSRKTTPQSRSISTDWAIQDTDLDNDLPNSAMVTKGKLLIAGQSEAKWRLSGAVELVLKEVPFGYNMGELVREEKRFGALIKVTDTPDRIPSYMRVHAGRLVLGDTTSLELKVESVEYSAPLPLSANTLQGEFIASNYRIQNFKTMTANDLRAIGAR